MFKALIGDKTLNILDKSLLGKREYVKSLESKDRKFLCPVCKEPLSLHWAPKPKRTPHFKHKQAKSCIYATGESAEHREGKLKLFYYFESLLQHKVKSIEIEHYLEETKQIADIYIEFRNSTKWVIEYQRSNISSEEIQSRKQLYQSLGINDIWIAGENLVSEILLGACSIYNAGQELIYDDTFSSSKSLLTFDPKTEQVGIIRGLQNMNIRSFTFDSYETYNLADIAFNVWGEPFSFDDYLAYLNKNTNEEIGSLSGRTEVPFLQKSPFGKNYFIKSDNNIWNTEEEKNKHHFEFDKYLIKCIPVEMKNLIMKVDFFYNHPEPFEEILLRASGIIPKRWEKFFQELENRDKQVEVNLFDWLAAKGMLMMVLEEIYQSRFQTEKEFNKSLNLILEGKQVPFYSKNYLLQKHGLIEVPFRKDKLNETITLEEGLEYLLPLIHRKFDNQNIIKEAIKYKVLVEEEINAPFTNKVLIEIGKRVKSLIPYSPSFYQGYTKRIGGLLGD